MSSKYKIKRNPSSLTDEQISRHKDFDRLLSNYQKAHTFKNATKPLYKNIGFMSLMVVVGVVLLVLLFDKKEENKVSSRGQNDQKSPESKVAGDTAQDMTGLSKDTLRSIAKTTDTVQTANVPVIAYELFRINPSKGATLYTTSGARILVPAQAFTDKSGRAVLKEVTLSYREIFNSTGEKITKPEGYPLIMIELKGAESSSKSVVQISKKIIVELTGTIRTDAGNIYYSIAEAAPWERKGEEQVVYRFTMQAEESQYPKQKAFKNMIWQISGASRKPSDFNYIFNRAWRDFEFVSQSGKKEVSVKNTNTSFRSTMEIIPLSGNAEQNKTIQDAVFQLYSSLPQSEPENLVSDIETWKTSAEGQAYLKWISNLPGENQIHSDKQTSIIEVPDFGYYCIVLPKDPGSKIAPTYYKRIILLESNPERSQHFSPEQIRQEPTLRR